MDNFTEYVEKKLSPEQKEELAANCKDLINNPAFNVVVTQVVAYNIQAMLAAPIGSDAARHHHAIMVGVDQFKAVLRQLSEVSSKPLTRGR